MMVVPGHYRLSGLLPQLPQGDRIIFSLHAKPQQDEVERQSQFLSDRARDLVEVQTRALMQDHRAWRPSLWRRQTGPGSGQIELKHGEAQDVSRRKGDKTWGLELTRHERDGDFLHNYVHVAKAGDSKPLDGFLQFLQGVDLAEMASYLNVEGETFLAAVVGKDSVRNIGLFDPTTTLNRVYAFVKLRVNWQNQVPIVTIVNAGGVNHATLLAALAENASLNWQATWQENPELWQLAAGSTFKRRFLKHVHGGETEAPLAKKKFLEGFKSFNWVEAFDKAIFRCLPKGQDIPFVVVGHLREVVDSVAIHFGFPHSWPVTTDRYFQLRLTTQRGPRRFQVAYRAVYEKGTGNHHILPLMCFNPSLTWTRRLAGGEPRFLDLLRQSFEEAIFPRLGLKRVTGGWSQDVRVDDFLQRLASVDFTEALENLCCLDSFSTRRFIDVVFVGNIGAGSQGGEMARWLGFHESMLREARSHIKANDYFQIKMRFVYSGDGRWSVHVLDATGMHKFKVLDAFSKNESVVVNRYQFVAQLRKPEEGLWHALPKRAQEKIAILIVGEGGVFRLDQVETAAMIQAVRRCLQDIVREERATGQVPVYIALSLFHYLHVVGVDTDDDADLKALWTRLRIPGAKRPHAVRFTRNRYASHVPGETPLAEHSWAQVFSNGLKVALQEFDRERWSGIGLGNLALRYKKDAYLYLLGALYGSLKDSEKGTAQLKREILSHVAERHIRGDRFPAFFAGWIEMSRLPPAQVYMTYRRDMAELGHVAHTWRVTPLRLNRGLVSSLNHFLWDEIFAEIPGLKRELKWLIDEDLRAFGAEIGFADLALGLTVDYFVVYIARLAQEKMTAWRRASAPSWEESRAILWLLMAERATSDQSFRLGFGDTKAKLALAQVYDFVERTYPAELAALLSGTWVFKRNELQGGRFVTASYSVDKKRFMENILKDFKFRDIIAVLGTPIS